MIAVLHVITMTLVALAAALSVAHALELPGKMRLERDQYFAVQQIYYPGFTIGGCSPPSRSGRDAGRLARHQREISSS